MNQNITIKAIDFKEIHELQKYLTEIISNDLPTYPDLDTAISYITNEKFIFIVPKDNLSIAKKLSLKKSRFDNVFNIMCVTNTTGFNSSIKCFLYQRTTTDILPLSGTISDLNRKLKLKTRLITIGLDNIPKYCPRVMFVIVKQPLNFTDIKLLENVTGFFNNIKSGILKEEDFDDYLTVMDILPDKNNFHLALINPRLRVFMKKALPDDFYLSSWEKQIQFIHDFLRKERSPNIAWNYFHPPTKQLENNYYFSPRSSGKYNERIISLTGENLNFYAEDEQRDTVVLFFNHKRQSNEFRTWKEFVDNYIFTATKLIEKGCDFRFGYIDMTYNAVPDFSRIMGSLHSYPFYRIFTGKTHLFYGIKTEKTLEDCFKAYEKSIKYSKVIQKSLPKDRSTIANNKILNEKIDDHIPIFEYFNDDIDEDFLQKMKTFTTNLKGKGSSFKEKNSNDEISDTFDMDLINKLESSIPKDFKSKSIKNGNIQKETNSPTIIGNIAMS